MRLWTLRTGLWLAAVAAGLPSLAADQAAPDNAEALPARMPRPWTQPAPRTTQEQYAETLRHWAEKHPCVMTLQIRGRSKEGQPLFLARVTDSSAPDDDKQIALLTGLHSGAERTETTCIFHVMDWLPGDSREAATTRRKQGQIA